MKLNIVVRVLAATLWLAMPVCTIAQEQAAAPSKSSIGLQTGGSANARPAISDTVMSEETVRQLCNTAATAIATAYVDRAKAPEHAAALRKACDSGQFDNLGKREFRSAFTDKLREITGDKHMYLRYERKLDAKPASTTAVVNEAMAKWRKEYGHGAQPFTPSAVKPGDAKWGEHGIEEVKMLDGGVGYIRVSMLPDISEAAGAAAATMREVGGAKALIFDMRDMRGGSQEMVNLFCSYLFADPHKHLLTMVFPAVNARDEQYTYNKIEGARLADIPVYILTNERTFSAGEAFTYILQQFKRATVVGETTGGGGNSNEFVPLGEGFAVSVSVGKTIHPVSKGSWEGVGVVPDVQVPAAQALDKARTLAAERVGGSGKSVSVR